MRASRISTMPAAAIFDRNPERVGDRRTHRLDREVAAELARTAQEVAGVDAAENDVGVGDGGSCATGAVARQPRCGASALRADLEQARARLRAMRSTRHRHRSMPRRSRAGRWYLPNTGVPVITGSPSTTRPTSKLVPPTSVVTMLGVPISRPSAAAPITPPAGPEASNDTARCLASSAEVTPPEECMIVNSLGRPPARSLSCNAVM